MRWETSALGLVFLPFIVAKVAGRLHEVGQWRPSGQRYLLGDAMVDLLNDVRPFDPDWAVLRFIQARVLGREQRPWRVKGTRFEIADFFDYGERSYLGDGIEVFFPVDPDRPGSCIAAINHLLGVFDALRSAGLQTTTCSAVRFMSKTRATLRDLPGASVLAEGQTVLVPSRALSELARLLDPKGSLVLHTSASARHPSTSATVPCGS